MLGVRGQFHLTIDEKGRISLPARIRDLLLARGDDALIFTNYKGSIWGYDLHAWERYESQLLDESPFQEDSLLFTRAFIAGASEVGVDKQGRILLPPYLRQYAGLEREVVIISVVDRLEIWSAQRWEEAYSRAVESLDQAGSVGRLKVGGRRDEGGK